MARTPPARDVFSLLGKRIKVWGIDVTNHCDAACSYCPHPTQERARGFMAPSTMKAVLSAMSNRRVNLHFFSEPLLHRQLEELIAMATQAGVDAGFSTNGRLLTQSRLDDLAEAGLRWLRLHVNAHKRDGVPFGRRVAEFVTPPGLVFTEHRVGVSGDDEMDAQVWDKGMKSQGGHLDLGEGKAARKPCSYLGTGPFTDEPWHVVLWDGRFAMCCVDIEGTFNPALCESCDGVVFRSPEVVGDYEGTGSAPGAQGYIKDEHQ